MTRRKRAWPDAPAILRSRSNIAFRRLQDAVPEGMSPRREDRGLSRRTGPRRVEDAAPPRRAGLRHREHAADHAADADRLLAAVAPRGQRRRIDARAGPDRAPSRAAAAPGNVAAHRDARANFRRISSISACARLRLQARVLHLDRLDRGVARARAGARAHSRSPRNGAVARPRSRAGKAAVRAESARRLARTPRFRRKGSATLMPHDLPPAASISSRRR